jgi:hypothetical protein
MAYLTGQPLYAYVINNTGETSVKGKLVQPDSTSGQVVLTGNDELDCIGVIDEAGIANGSVMRIVTGGRTQVLLEDNTGSTAGYWAATGDAAYAQSLAAPPGAVLAHFQEIGHFIETVAAGGAGTHVLAEIIMHFN